MGQVVERDLPGMLIRVGGVDLPGRTSEPGLDFADGHHNIHVAVEGRKGQGDLFGLVPMDLHAMNWDLACEVGTRSGEIDLTGPQLQVSPRRDSHISPGCRRPRHIQDVRSRRALTRRRHATGDGDLVCRWTFGRSPRVIRRRGTVALCSGPPSNDPVGIREPLSVAAQTSLTREIGHR